MMDETKCKEKEFNLEGLNAHNRAQKLIDKNYQDHNDESKKFNRHEFYEYVARAVGNCDFLNSFYTQKYQKSQNLEDLYCASMARFADNLIRMFYNPITDSNNITLQQKNNYINYFRKKLQKGRDYFMKNIILGPLQIAYLPYVKQTVKKIMNNYAYIKYKLLPQNKNLINYGRTIDIINEDIKKFLGIDMKEFKNNIIKVNYKNIVEHLVTGNYSLDAIEKMHKEIENVAKRYNTYRNIEDTTPCDNKLHTWGMEEQLRKNIDEQKDPTKKKILNKALKDLRENKSVDMALFGD